MGVPADAVGCLPAPLRSGLRQKAAGDFPPAPLTLAGQCHGDPDLSARARRDCMTAFRLGKMRQAARLDATCGSELPGHSPKNGRDRVARPLTGSATEKPRRHVLCYSGGHSKKRRDRLQVRYRGTPQKSHKLPSAGRKAPSGKTGREVQSKPVTPQKPT